MPSVDPVAFFAALVTRISVSSPGQSASDATCTAREFAHFEPPPPSSLPWFQRTKPPKRERQAEPEPWRAITDSADSPSASVFTPRSLASAKTRHA